MDPISRGREQTHLLKHGFFASITAMAILVALAAPASARGYTFTKLADSTEDNFDPFNFGCASINGERDVSFRAGRLAADGFNTIPGIYRVNAADGSITTIAEDDKRFNFLGLPSMNDAGQVSFAARIDQGKKNDTESILRGSTAKLTTHRRIGRRVQLLRLRHLDQHQRRGGLQGRARRGVQLR